MSKKATHYGTCQVCGRQQKLPGGFMSKHGYTVEWGWFNGVCPGADHLPFEKSKDLIEKAIKDVQANIAALEAEIEKLMADGFDEFAWVHHYGRSGYSRKSGYRWMRVNPAHGKLRDSWERKTWYYQVDGEDRRHEMTTYGQGNERKDICRVYNERYCNQLRKQIKGGHEYIAWQEARIKDWKEQDLQPIK